jgi:hypothetical protein
MDMLVTYPQPSLENLGKYYESVDYISHTDSKDPCLKKRITLLKSIALKNKLELINSLQPAKGRILDIGAGTGDFICCKTKRLANHRVEPSDKAKVIALKEVSFVEDTAELQNQSFDVISMWHVLEHVPNLDNQIIETIIKTKWFIDRGSSNFKSFDAKHYGAFGLLMMCRSILAFSKKAIKHFDKKGCNWKSAPDEI